LENRKWNFEKKQKTAENEFEIKIEVEVFMNKLIKLTNSLFKLHPRKSNYSNWPFLTSEHLMISQSCKSFADTELVPIAAKIDKEHFFPTEQIRKLGALGIMGIAVSTEYGGSGMDTVSYAIAMEEISKACASTGVIVSANNSLFCSPVEKYGNHEQKLKYLQPW
jgi:butyryl-CoA dehydrogenase